MADPGITVPGVQFDKWPWKNCCGMTTWGYLNNIHKTYHMIIAGYEFVNIIISIPDNLYNTYPEEWCHAN